MLKDNKLIFEDKVKGILEKSMYETLICTFNKGGDQLIDKYVQNNIHNMAESMAKTFSEIAAKPLTDYIDEHIKSAGININISPAALALSSSTGPVTGNIIINDATSKIEII